MYIWLGSNLLFCAFETYLTNVMPRKARGQSKQCRFEEKLVKTKNDGCFCEAMGEFHEAIHLW